MITELSDTDFQLLRWLFTKFQMDGSSIWEQWEYSFFDIFTIEMKLNFY